MSLTLLVDVGNTRLKWALTEAGTRGPVLALPYTLHQLSMLLDEAWGQMRRPQRLVVASVAEAVVNDAISHWSERHWTLPPRFVRSEVFCLGVSNAYPQPGRLGIDRWLALIAAYQRRRSAVGVVDCGSAATIDLVDDQGRHGGGWILPGLAMSGECLRAKTAIPSFADLVPIPSLGKDTAAGIANGALAAVAGAVLMADRIATQQLGIRDLKWMITGGDAARLAGALPLESEIITELVMDGLNLVADSQVEVS